MLRETARTHGHRQAGTISRHANAHTQGAHTDEVTGGKGCAPPEGLQSAYGCVGAHVCVRSCACIRALVCTHSGASIIAANDAACASSPPSVCVRVCIVCACVRACARSRARTRGRPSCATGRPPPPRAAAAPPPAPPGGPAPARRSEPSGGAASTQTRPSQNYNDNKSGKPRPSNCVRLTGDARAVQPRRIRRSRVDANKAIAQLCGTQSGKPSRWPGAFALSTVAFSMIWVISRAL